MPLTPQAPNTRLRPGITLPNLPTSPDQLLEWAEKVDAALTDRDAEIAALLAFNVHNAGTAVISGASTSVAVTFGAQEDDAGYFVQTAVIDKTDATPAAGSLRTSVDDIATTGFTINIEAAPGGADTVTVAWAVIR